MSKYLRTFLEVNYKLNLSFIFVCYFVIFHFSSSFSDFDDDNMISSRDLVEIIKRITTADDNSDSLNDEEMQQLIDNVSVA